GGGGGGVEGERVGRLDADSGEPGPQGLFHVCQPDRGAELEEEVQVGERVALGQLLVDLRPFHLGGAGEGRLVQEARQRLELVASLHLLHVLDVGGVEELRADDRKGELRLAAGHPVKRSSPFRSSARRASTPPASTTWTPL